MKNNPHLVATWRISLIFLAVWMLHPTHGFVPLPTGGISCSNIRPSVAHGPSSWTFPPSLDRHASAIYRWERHDRSNMAAASSQPSLSAENTLSADYVYLDIQVEGQDLGRLIFQLTNPSNLPLHAENFIQLAKASRRSIDPLAHYVGCTFDYSPATIEDGFGRYRWGHQCVGRKRNAIGRADQPIQDKENQLKCTHACFGGQYYGDEYLPNNNNADDGPAVLLTVPVVGPGYGTSKFSIVRVQESPKEWGDRLLINSGVIGRLLPQSLSVLHAMARQRQGPPTIQASGTLDEADFMEAT